MQLMFYRNLTRQIIINKPREKKFIHLVAVTATPDLPNTVFFCFAINYSV